MGAKYCAKVAKKAMLAPCSSSWASGSCKKADDKQFQSLLHSDLFAAVSK
jgi:hypothetical protein